MTKANLVLSRFARSQLPTPVLKLEAEVGVDLEGKSEDPCSIGPGSKDFPFNDYSQTFSSCVLDELLARKPCELANYLWTTRIFQV